MKKYSFIRTAIIALAGLVTISCGRGNKGKQDRQTTVQEEKQEKGSKFLNKPLVEHIYTADPSAHVFEDRIYIYPSHDIDTGTEEDDFGGHFDMRDYHVLSMDSVGGEITDHGIALSVDNVPWAERQLWAPDAACKDGICYLYFPAKDKEGIFRIGVAVSDSPEGPFRAEKEPIKGSLSIDPAVFRDDDGEYYMYVGGIWGGQLQNWRTGTYDNTAKTPYDNEPADDEPAISPRVARLSDDMLQFEEELREIEIVDGEGNPILAGDHERRFFEAAWVHKYNRKYYFSYSTGDTHFIAYAIGESPYGPFVYQGNILNPVQGWTNHHSIVEIKGQWYLFYHDTELSGQTHLRNVKMTKLEHDPDGTIKTINVIIE
ncbi:glycoside hydrolase family 43 protein [Sinomicrobium weinanense]|uniref:Glycoside hydrolase family 43 protein n=1 Tax=Sinomicrobium weinanense TaxID=2842200 RepID=A0A926JTS6_9FLAO|nr:glycoside hydrolase family 43 protein [Sinomicrobium weinanense]MBC9797400.1 glycoside hydrolase family 43 protein [Sinomicrobium weinanense]MBU3124555.1 glycoside hydrolase family 43 protein [Sinomicrobium weinanense]